MENNIHTGTLQTVPLSDVADSSITNTGITPMDHTNFFDSMKEKLSPHAWLEKIQANKDLLIEMSLCTIVGFIVGFLMKKFSTLILFLALTCGLILFLQYQDFISIGINWQHFQNFFGIQPLVMPDGNAVSFYWQWIMGHLGLVVSFAIGCGLGLRLG